MNTNQVNNEVFYGTVPVLHNERVYSFKDILFVTGTWSIATWVYVQGGNNASLLGMREALTSTLFGMTIAGFILFLAVIITTRYGIDIWVYQRALFGYVGVIFLSVLAIGISMGMLVTNAAIYGNSLLFLSESAGITLDNSWLPWISSTCILLGGWIAFKGPIVVKYMSRIMVPLFLLVGAIIVYTVFSQFSLSELASVEPAEPNAYGSDLANYMMVMEWNFAFVFAWFVALGVYARLVKNERSSYWGHLGGFSVLMAIFVCIGSLTALAMISVTGRTSIDPTEWLVELGGPVLGSLSLIMIVLANITTHAVTIYSFSVSTKIVNPRWSYTKVLVFWSIFCIALVFWGGILDYYDVLLSLFGAICGPIIALVLVDFYIIRKRKVSLNSLFQINGDKAYKYTGGFNILAIISLVIGILSYLYVYNPITATINNDIFLYTTATGLSMIVSGGVYYLFSLFKPFNLYLRKHSC
ncbi:purine-cytosine permease family protein [Natribacillus halophilus]|uniref:Nucleobase:cation symporter-1, NCS1 family n=1 Tax=Natribacillus halophilus TaxID=549003 RepID=A0A1G8SHH8_9BACI|nr:cytosine permease [Natribacillus halophilus]SDJ28667.1 nucleobase:cation symporter-1, NCS1 family [Natribacillus halophilus]